MNITKGMVVKSGAGHDKGSVYLVMESESNFAVLVNGKNKKLSNPKRKKIKHLEYVTCPDVDGMDNLSDKRIRRLLREIAVKSV